MDDEQFFAWIDGELHGEEADKVAAAVAASSELAARAERHRQLAFGLRDAFMPIAEAGVSPPRFQSAEVIDFGVRATERKTWQRWLSAPQWGAMAASLAIGIIVGSQFTSVGTGSPVAIENGRLVAAARLENALSTRLASMPIGDGVRIGLTFRSASGQICRSFNDGRASGLACRDRGDWQIRGLFQAGETGSGDYRMAAGEDPRLAALIDESIRGEPFDAAQERAAQREGWR